MDERLLHQKLDKLLAGVSECKGEMNGFNRRLEEHTEQDDRNFTTLGSKIEEVDDELGKVRESVIRIEVAAELAEKVGHKAGRGVSLKYTPIISGAIIGIYEVGRTIFETYFGG